MIQSFSGTHPFRPQCLREAVDRDSRTCLHGFGDFEEACELVIEDTAYAEIIKSFDEEDRGGLIEDMALDLVEVRDRDVERTTVFLVTMIDEGRCPRCGKPAEQPGGLATAGPELPFEHGDEPAETRRVPPAGSRITSCRCIPVCSDCGLLEAFVGFSGKNSIVYWPLKTAAVATELDNLGIHLKPAGFLDVESEMVITDEGVAPIERGQKTGGWAEFGYDDTQDREERER